MLNESSHFLSLFRDEQIIIFNKGVKTTANDNLLFHINATHYLSNCEGQENVLPERTLTLQVPCAPSSLSSLNVFVCAAPLTATLIIWYGAHCHETEKLVGESVCNKLIEIAEPGTYKKKIRVREGGEPQVFWDALGGKEVYVSVSEQQGASRFLGSPVCMFRPGAGSHGMEMERVDSWDSSDFGPRRVYFVELFGRLHVWLGREVSARRRQRITFLARSYQKACKCSAVVYENDGQESGFLRGCIPALFRKSAMVDPYAAKERRLVEMNVAGKELPDEYTPTEQERYFWLQDLQTNKPSATWRHDQYGQWKPACV